MRTATFLIVLALSAGCGADASVEEIPVGTEVVVETDAGTLVTGRLTRVEPETVTLTDARGVVMPLRREAIAAVDAAVATPPGPGEGSSVGTSAEDIARIAPAETDAAVADDPPVLPSDLPLSEPAYRMMEVPAGTRLAVRLDNAVGSEVSQVEDVVRATVRDAVTARGVEVIPAGSALAGHVTRVERSGKVEGRASVAFRFTRLHVAGTDEVYDIHTEFSGREAPGTKKEDAATIALPAAGGAIIGAIAGGKKGAAIGTVIGGGAGAAVVLTTRGEPVRVEPGTALVVELAEPVTVKVTVPAS